MGCSHVYLGVRLVKWFKYMEVTYTKRICLFLDILGFSALVKSQSCEVVYNIVQGIKSELESNKLAIKQIYIEPIATTFSDCIVLSIEADESDVEQASNILISATVKMLQETYLNQQIALRGGMAYGELFHHRTDGVFGPAMIKAYELESQFADWPRVIFDQSLIKHFKNKTGLPTIGFTNYGDGFWGVDCLNRIEDVLNRERIYNFETATGKEFLEMLRSINKITEEKLEEHYGNPKVYAKYLKLRDRIYLLLKRFNQLPPYFSELELSQFVPSRSK